MLFENRISGFRTCSESIFYSHNDITVFYPGMIDLLSDLPKCTLDFREACSEFETDSDNFENFPKDKETLHCEGDVIPVYSMSS